MARAHIFPRALVHDMKDGGSVVHAVDRNRRGILNYQSGPWDARILCRTCEAQLSACDDYAIKWIRRFDQNAVPLFGGKGFEVPNPKPHLLVRFAAATLWRASVSSRHAQSDLDLGPWETKLRGSIFAGTRYQPRLFVARKRYVTEGVHHGAIVVHPHYAPGWGKRAYVFEIADLFWGLKLDNRSGVEKLFEPPFLANDANPAIVPNMGDVELGDQHDLMSIFAAAEGIDYPFGS